MTDEKKPSEDLGEIDWDEALSEWEKTSFVPEVAKDVLSDKPAALAGSGRPLYRPPTVSPALKPKPATLPRIPRWSLEEEEEGGGDTRVALIPEELLHIEEGEDEGQEKEEAKPVPSHRSPLPTQPADDEMFASSFDEVEEATLIRSDLEIPRAAVPPLLAPKLRHYDPNEETVVGTADAVHKHRSLLAEVSGMPTEDPDDKQPTVRPAVGPEPVTQTRSWPNERPASEWLSDAARESLEAKASWLESEARAVEDKSARARALLVCSEICATLGERERAQALAAEARDRASSFTLAHQQARALLPVSPAADRDYVDALGAESKMSPAEPARVHFALLAADVLQAAGEEDAATPWLESAASVAAEDVRVAVVRAARALAGGRTADPALAFGDAPELTQLADAVGVCLRLRGVDNGRAPTHERSPSELLLLARRALDKGDAAAAASLVAELAGLPELAPGAVWLAASLGATQATRRADSARWLRELAERGDEDARRALVARYLELGERESLAEAIGQGGALTSAERVTIATLADLPLLATDPHLDATASTPGMQTLAAAVTALAMPTNGHREAQIRARARRTVGSPRVRAVTGLARLLAAPSAPADIEEALRALDSAGAPPQEGELSPGEGRPACARAIGLEMAARSGRAAEVSSALEAWGTGGGSREGRVTGALAAALVAERAGDRLRAVEAFKAARTADPTNEAALRAIASLEQVDLVAEMNELADELRDGPRAAMARIEAAARGEGGLPEPTRAHMLERAHSAWPSLPIAAFLAERIARRTGDVDEVLRWVRERREASSDSIEAALDAVREALLIADREPLLAGERLHEAHRARPDDVALRELYERMGSETHESRASWREQRAAQATGDGGTLLMLEAAYEYERAGDEEAALRCAEAAGASDTSLGGVARERAELRARRVARLADELLATAKGAGDTRARREAYERLAVLDATARQDPASALLWHRSILEDLPGHEPSLRHVEQHLIGEGRDQELEPIAAAIAGALRGTGAGECTAHAELAVRLRLRGSDARWDTTREAVELAASESEPSLWSLRMLQAHARSTGDDAAFLTATLKVLNRTLRSAETATLLTRAGEAASRLGRLEQAAPLLERATIEDSHDVVAWTHLVDVRRRMGDTRGAADACEALARSSAVREHKLQAWHDAGCIWLEEAKDDARAIIAFEAAAAIDIAHGDVFDRLSSLYASRRMLAELASLLERRIAGITDPDERVAMEVKRGRALLEATDVEGARRAFETVLAERPEDATALSAFADLCGTQRDWEAAEQALVRLARLLPTPEEQRNVYARLGELYAMHLMNLPRAEIALKEVLKRSPEDVETIEKLVEVYRRQNDAPHAVELQQELISKARAPEEKRKRTLALASIHEETAMDKRRAEQTLESARRESPQDVEVLRALAEFYMRHHQTPAVNILLDRAGGDARRALAAGRVSAALFEVLATVFELRGKTDAARVTRGIMAALGDQPVEIAGAGNRAFDRKLDDLLAPEGLPAPVRALLMKTGDALDQVAPVDLRALKATLLPAEHPLVRLADGVGQAVGFSGVQVLVSPKLGAACIPVGSSPAAVVVGEALSGNERIAPFLVLRAMKLVQARASALARTPPADLAVLVSAWLKCLNPTWQPQGVNAALIQAASGRLQAALPRNLSPEVGTLALEAAGAIGSQPAALGAQTIAWADRVALLAVGDCGIALDAIAAITTASGAAGAPPDPKDRAAWVARTPAARDLLAFAVTDAFADARGALGL